MLGGITDHLTTPGGPDGETPKLDADVDTIGHIVGNRRRRLVIQFLNEHGATQLNELADFVASHEADGYVEYNDRKSAYVSLYQHHLDQLSDAGALKYDDRKHVMPDRNLSGFAAIVDILEATQGGDRD